MKNEVNVTKYIVELKDKGFFKALVGFNYSFVDEADKAYRFDTREDAEKTGAAGLPKQSSHYRVLEFTIVQTYTISYGVEWTPREPDEYWQIQVRYDGSDDERNFLISNVDGEMFTGIRELGGCYSSELIAIAKAFDVFLNENVKEIRLVKVVDESVTFDEWRDYLSTRGAFKMLDARDKGYL